jgi:hypothetical protein
MLFAKAVATIGYTAVALTPMVMAQRGLPPECNGNQYVALQLTLLDMTTDW